MGMKIFIASGECRACHTIEGIAPGGVGPDVRYIGSEAANLNMMSLHNKTSHDVNL